MYHSVNKTIDIDYEDSKERRKDIIAKDKHRPRESIQTESVNTRCWQSKKTKDRDLPKNLY